MMNGWDDDDDLADLEIDDEHNDDNQDMYDNAVASTPQEQEQGGWENDEELFGDDNNEVDTLRVQQPQLNASVLSDIGHNPRVRTPSPFTEDAHSPVTARVDCDDTETEEGGWGDDEEIFDNEEQLLDINSDRPFGAPTRAKSPSGQDLFQKLQDYVGSLARMLSSINAILEYEYNTPEKAHELLNYYAERPGLAQYTRTKELPRMNYHVVLPNGHVETNKQAIADHHLPDASLLARCANQSLLADLLQVLTGPDLVVRPQFLAVCVAETCQFRLHYGDNGRDMLQVNCMLQLSLPVAEGPRLNVATIRATIAFSPRHESPTVKFKVDKIVVLLKESQYSKLHEVVNFIYAMEGQFDQGPGHVDVTMQNAPADIFRDAFLEQSQQLMNQSKAGMKSALKDMESVIGLKSKFKAVQSGFSKFLPATNVLLEAEEEARTLAAERETQQALLLRPSIAAAHSTMEPPANAGHPLPRSKPAMMGSVATQETSRPRSILGGIVKTGWGALAKSITIPDDDPAIYGPPPQRLPPVFYRKEEPENTNESSIRGAGPQPTVEPSWQPSNNIIQRAKDEPAPRSGLHIPERNAPGNVGLKPLDLAFDEDSGDGWDDDLDLTTDFVVEAKEEGEDHIDNDADHTASLLQASDPSERDRCANAPHKEIIASSNSVVSPSKIPSPAQSIPVLAKSTTSQNAKARPTKIPTYPACSPTKVRVGVPSSSESPKLSTKRPLMADISYNPEDDIIPTRQRWVNPRASRPQLFAGAHPADKQTKV